MTAADTDDIRAQLMGALGAEPEPDADAPVTDLAPAADPEPPVETQEQVDARSRDDKGRFAPKTPVDVTAPVAVAPVDAPTQVPSDMPPGPWSPAAKATWSSLPAEVKADVLRREREVSDGFKKYEGLASYVESAAKARTTLPEALARYTEAEQFLEKDPVNGILWLAQNYNVQPQQLLNAMGITPQQVQQQPQGQPQQPYLPPEIVQRLQRVDMLEKEFYGSKQAAVESDINSFIGDQNNIYAENVIDQMIGFLQDPAIRSLASNKEKLSAAYDRAVWSNPEIRPLLLKQSAAATAADTAAKAKAVANQARTAGRSISTGGLPASQPVMTSNADDLRASLEEKFHRGGRV